MKKMCAIALAGTLLLGGCATNTGTGASVGTIGGAGAGALLGQIIGHSTQATLIGAAAGAVIGGLAGTGVGYMMDKQEADMRNALAQSEAIAVQREGEMLALTFKSDLTFATNSASIRPGLQNELNRVASVMKKYPQTTIQVAGYTDNTGTVEYNQTLSERRAESVKKQLVYNGVSAQRIATFGFGIEQPVATNKTAEGRAKNRRVEIRIMPTES